ncbi:MAG: hypothetical protein WKI04_18360 [Ferruginibacter sp.]
MKRRSAIRDLVIIAGGAVFLPACKGRPENLTVRVKNIKIDAKQEKLLEAIASTILPTTDTPGAGGWGHIC